MTDTAGASTSATPKRRVDVTSTATPDEASALASATPTKSSTQETTPTKVAPNAITISGAFSGKMNIASVACGLTTTQAEPSMGLRVLGTLNGEPAKLMASDDMNLGVRMAYLSIGELDGRADMFVTDTDQLTAGLTVSVESSTTFDQVTADNLDRSGQVTIDGSVSCDQVVTNAAF